VTVGGGYGMGHAVHDAFTRLADQVAHIQVDNAGHYPLEQHPPITTELALRLPHPVGPLD
jgi:hypothetical protein